MDDARAVIERLELKPHPEGGWYRETWRAPPERPGGRSPGTAILFLLEAGQTSRWHRVIDAAELWVFQAGTALTLKTAPGEAGPVATVRLGADILAGDTPQHLRSLSEAIAAGNAATMRKAAHTLKSSSANVGADTLAQLCKDLEQLGRNDTTSGAPALLTAMEREFSAVRGTLSAMFVKET